MREYILYSGNSLFKVSLGNKNQIVLTESKNEQIVSQNVIFQQPCLLFSCDTDINGTIHCAAVTRNTLTYITVNGGKTATTHLMHLPEKFSICGVCLNADKDIRLHYCVKSSEGTAVIEYTLSGDEWKGKNLLTDEGNIELLCIKKGCEECYVYISSKNKTVNAYDGKEIFSSSSAPKYAQSTKNGLVFIDNGTVFSGADEISLGEAVYVLDGERLLINRNGKLAEMITSPLCRPAGESCFPKSPREYVYCTPENDKRIILSSPFPYIRFEPERIQGAGLAQEVYMQQRTLFSLQAEVRELKNRVRFLEEERKRH